MNTRRISQHSLRATIPLSGEWTCYFPAHGTAIKPNGWKAGEPVTLNVPGVWEQVPAKVNYRGQAVARREFSTNQDGPARLVFKGVSHSCKVLLDGREIGSHHNAYTPFSMDLANLPAGQHELLVWISNEHGERSALHVPNDYYNYGGISRPVELQLLQSPVFIKQVQFTPFYRDGTWQASFRSILKNLGDPRRATLHLSLAGKSLQQSVECPPGATEVEVTMAVHNVEAWSPEDPNLYALEARLEGDSISDDWHDRVGFRTIETSGSRLLLNGEPVFLKGFNRHEDHPDFGCALPVELMRRDLELFRDMGANAVRTSHYPNDERFLDLCDEMGFLVWEENHARGLFPGGAGSGEGKHPMQHPEFREQCRLCNEEMVTEHFNYPSIVLWGILNECDSFSDYGRSCYREQFNQIKALDPSRPTTYASCHYGGARQERKDICQDLPDVCGWNFYHNWYSQRPVDKALEEALGKWDPEMKGKPMIVSEFGGGAIPGYHDPVRRAKWSEDRQADIIDECLSAYLHHPRLCGAFIWQFCDVRVDDSWANARPRCMNNKGIVDEYRRPKLAYSVVRRHFRA